MFASYRFDNDNGQRGRRIERPQDIISSYPILFHQPEIRLAIKLTKNIDWNLGYQYYSYEEKQYPLPFASINSSVLIPKQVAPQNYTAHLPYTSLTFYFGKSAQDRIRDKGRVCRKKTPRSKRLRRFLSSGIQNR